MRVEHHEEGVETIKVRCELIVELVGHTVCSRGPRIDDLVVPLTFGDNTGVVVVFDLINFLLCLVDDRNLFGWDHYVCDRHRESTTSSGLEAGFLELVEELNGLCKTSLAEAIRDHLTQTLLAEHLIHVPEFFRNDEVEDDAT